MLTRHPLPIVTGEKMGLLDKSLNELEFVLDV